MRIVITYQQRDDFTYQTLIGMAFDSAKRFGYETVLVGNTYMQGDIKMEFLPEEEPRLMNWILAAQLAYIQSPLFDQPTVIFSPDALILKPLEEVFEKDFDVAFTDRKNPKWPINNGVIYLKPERKQALAAFWQKALDVCKSYPVETQDWYGDQQALHDVLQAGVHQQIGLHVELLPCEVYNASPMKPGAGFDKRLIKDAYVAHFKGKRKSSMKDYWRYVCKKS